MNLAPDGMAFLDVLASYTRTIIFFCILVHAAAIVVSRVLGNPSLQRMSLSVTSAFAAFAAASYSTESHVFWVALSCATFFSTYYLMPSFVAADAVSSDHGGSDAC